MDFIKYALNNKSIVVISISILTAIIIAILYTFKFKFNMLESFTSNSYKPNSGNSSESTNNPVEIILFSVDWCPHCKVARPEWDKVSEEYTTKLIKGRQIIFKDINCNEETPEITTLISKYKIEGYPTVKLLKDGEVIDFEAKPTQSNLQQFLNTVI